MKVILILSALLAIASADTSDWLDFRVKYVTFPNPIGIGSTSYIPIQKTLAKGLEKGWVLANTTNSLNATTLCWSKLDNRMCPVYDGKGNVAGMLLAIPVEDVEGQGIPYDFNDFEVYEKKIINGDLYWTSTYYLIDPEIIANNGTRPTTKTIGDGLWLKSADRFIEIPTDLESIKNETLYTWQNCIPAMGTHYYYNMTPETKCEKTEPFFLLVQHGNIVGLGWQFFGKTQYVDKNWYDDVNELAVKLTVPNGPTCLATLTNQFGVISTHMYFVNNPWLIPCTQATDSVSPIPILP